MDLIGNQKTKLAFWLLDNLDRENKITMTYRQIADKSGMSYQTVYRTMNALIESDFLVKINGGAYRVNPDVLFKGGKSDRLNVLLQYRDEKYADREEAENVWLQGTFWLETALCEQGDFFNNPNAPAPN